MKKKTDLNPTPASEFLKCDLNQLPIIDITGAHMDVLAAKLKEAVSSGDGPRADKLMQELADAREHWIEAQQKLFKGVL